jgi:hypothetical protein
LNDFLLEIFSLEALLLRIFIEETSQSNATSRIRGSTVKKKAWRKFDSAWG